jgi:probable HAF family extracellular repeat protein
MTLGFARAGALCLTLVSGGLAAQPASQYTITGLGGFSPTALNDLGKIVGSVTDSSGYQQAVVYDSGVLHNLATPSGTILSQALDINNRNQIVGFMTSAGHQQAFLYSNGVVQGIGQLDGYMNSVAKGINNNGQIVGYSFSQPTPAGFYPNQAFLYSDGQMQSLAPLGPEIASSANTINDSGRIGGWSDIGTAGLANPFILNGDSSIILPSFGNARSGEANAINSQGQVVGYIEAPPGSYGYRAFMYTNGELKNLGALANRQYENSFAYGINSLGQVIGQSSSLDGERPFVYSGNNMYDLSKLVVNGLGWSLVRATDINESGQIIGSGIYNGQAQAFLLTPVPEPTGYALAATGFCVLAFLKRRKKADPAHS